MSNISRNIIEEIAANLNNNAPDKILFIQRTKFRQEKWENKEVITLINALIDFHAQKNLSSNDKVIICAPNSPYWGCIFLACALKNIVVVPLDFNSSEELINTIIQTTKPKLLYISKYKETKIKEDIDVQYIENIEDNAKNESTKTKLPVPEISLDSLMEIVFTSGSTGHPKGTLISYDNITSNIHNLLEIIKLHSDTKLLSIIPLSHMFEQVVGFMTPLKLGLVIVYPYILTSTEIMRALNENRITSVVSVPAFIKLIKDAIEREAKQKNKLQQLTSLLSVSGQFPFGVRRFLFSPIHTSLGGNLREFYIGGAPLDHNIENFWDNLGVQVLQGYGLTECSPLVTMNAGAFYKKYSVGRCVPNQEIQLLHDGEILVKGRNVSSGYYNEPRLTQEVFQDSWFHTGDLGELDKDGNLFIKGRKKNVIVNTAGMKIYPEDLEGKLNQFSEIKDCIVVGLEEHNSIVITAVIIPKDAALDTNEIIETVNTSLASHQKIQKAVIWKENDFPRTPTRKIIRYKILATLQSAEKNSQSNAAKSSASVLIKILSELSNSSEDKITPQTNLVLDLHMDSIKRLELLSRIQDEMHGYIDEQAINQYITVEELEKNIKTTQNYQKIMYPSWQLSTGAVLIRSFFQNILFLIMNMFQKLHVINQEVVPAQHAPVIIIANHTSHLDAPTILKSLPQFLRENTCSAAAKDYFFTNKILGFGVRVIINGFPIEREKNITETMMIIGNLLNQGKSVLIFPEGTRSVDGKIGEFKKGIGVLSQEMKVPILPIKIHGNYEILPKGRHVPKFGKTEVTFGKPIILKRKVSYIDAAEIIEKALRDL